MRPRSSVPITSSASAAVDELGRRRRRDAPVHQPERQHQHRRSEPAAAQMAGLPDPAGADGRQRHGAPGGRAARSTGRACRGCRRGRAGPGPARRPSRRAAARAARRRRRTCPSAPISSRRACRRAPTAACIAGARPGRRMAWTRTPSARPEPRPPRRSQRRSATCATPPIPTGRAARRAGAARPGRRCRACDRRASRRGRAALRPGARALTPAPGHPLAGGGGSSVSCSSGSRPGSSAGVKARPSTTSSTASDGAGRQLDRPVEQHELHSLVAVGDDSQPQGARAAQRGVGGERVGRRELRQRADRLRARALHEVGPEPLGDPRGGDVLECGLQRGDRGREVRREDVGVGEVGAHRQRCAQLRVVLHRVQEEPHELVAGQRVDADRQVDRRVAQRLRGMDRSARQVEGVPRLEDGVDRAAAR